jgi:hypothetical protein
VSLNQVPRAWTAAARNGSAGTVSRNTLALVSLLLLLRVGVLRHCASVVGCVLVRGYIVLICRMQTVPWSLVLGSQCLVRMSLAGVAPRPERGFVAADGVSNVQTTPMDEGSTSDMVGMNDCSPVFRAPCGWSSNRSDANLTYHLS